MADELSAALAEGIDERSVSLESEEVNNVGASRLDTIVEATGASTEDQLSGYAVTCDLLATRLKQGADQVFGCLLIAGDADPGALASALEGMTRPDGTFTPVLPLTADQVTIVKDADDLFEFVDAATALIEVAASRTPATQAVAETALGEIDELVARHQR